MHAMTESMVAIPADMPMAEVVKLHSETGGVLQFRFGQAFIAADLLPFATAFVRFPCAA